MSKPDAPAAPDYAAAATAQGVANKETAVANAGLNRVDQVGPNGTIQYSLREGADPLNPQVGDYTQTTTLSPAQQGLYDSTNSISQSLLNTATSGLQRVDSTMSQPLDKSSVRAYQGAPDAPTYAALPGAVDYQALPGAQDYQAGPATRTGYTTDVKAEGFSGGVGTSTFQKGPDTRSMTDLQAGPTNDVSAAQAALQTFNPNGFTPQQVDTTFGATRASPQGVDDTSRQRVEQALLSRLEPQYARDEMAMRTQLLNQGLEVGTTAYNAELDRLARARNDARMQAVIAGGQEETRQAGLDASLQAQEYSQAMGRGTFAQTGQTANNNFGLSSQKLGLDATSLNNQTAVAGANLGLAANAQNFGQAQAVNNSINANQVTEFGMDKNRVDTANTNANNLFQQGATNANLQNTGANANLTAALASANLNNSALNSQYSQDLNAVNIGNSAVDARYGQQFAQTAAANSNATANYGQTSAQTTAGNQNLTTNYNQGLAAANQNNQLSDAEYQRMLLERQLPLNELNSLRTGVQIQNPGSSVPIAQANAQAAPVFDATTAQGNYDMAAYNQQMAGYNGLLGGLAKVGSAMITAPSDIRLKRNIQPLGKRNGHSWYSWDWRDGSGSSEGVLAQEIQQTHPEAVGTLPNGFLGVNYSLLGL